MSGRNRYRIEALREFLRGSWRVEREILDCRTGLVGSFRGSVTYLPDGGGLQCREAGRMVLGGYSGLAHREYVYGFPSPRRAEVSFTDGRAFHDLDLSSGRWAVVHLCAADRYDGSFAVEGENRWLTVWKIEGPNKAARLRSIHVRGPAM